MRKLGLVGLCVMLAFGFAGMAAAAEDVTLSGTLMCAKCSLKKADAKDCQDVLVTKDDAGKTDEYYIVKNDVAKDSPHTCTTKVPATVTGSVTEKDGKKWIAATKIEREK